MNIISFILLLLLYIYGIIMLKISFLAKKKGENEAYINNIAISLVYIISITANILIVNFVLPTKINFIKFPFDILMLGFVCFFLPIFYLFMKREKRKHTKNNNYKPLNPMVLPLKYDIYRKLTHLVVLVIILFYFTLGFLIKNFFISFLKYFPRIYTELFFSIYTIENNIMIFTHYLVVFLVGISLIGLLTADFVRILKPERYPLKAVNHILKEKELHLRLGPQISMAVGCFSIIILFGLFQPLGPLIICTSMTMAISGDIGSNLVGRTIGYRFKKIPNRDKTYLGLIAGILCAYISGLLILLILNSFFIITQNKFYLLAIIGALIIGILDYFDLEVDDNLSFILTTTAILFLLSFFLI